MEVQQLTKAQLEVSPGVNIRGDILGAGGFGTQQWRLMGNLPGLRSGSHSLSLSLNNHHVSIIPDNGLEDAAFGKELRDRGPKFWVFGEV